MIDFEDGEWIITTANGYYTSSPKGDQYLSVKVGGKDYSTEQLRESFYRPDLVQVALSGGFLKDLKKVTDVKPPPMTEIVDTPISIDRRDVAVTLKAIAFKADNKTKTYKGDPWARTLLLGPAEQKMFYGAEY